LLGRPLRELYDQESQEALSGEYAEACDKCIPGVDRTLVTQDGRTIQTKLFAMPYSFGQLHGTRSGYLDVTAEKRAETEASLATQAIFELLDTLHLALMVVDRKGQLLARNLGTEKLFGHSIDSIIELAESNETVRDMFQMTIRKKEPVSKVLKFEGPSDRMIDISLSAWPIENHSKEVTRVLFVGRRMTSLMRAESRSAALALEFQQFVENANAPIFGIDHEGQVNEWNRMTELLTGFSKVEVIGKNVTREFLSGDERSSFEVVLKNALEGQASSIFESSFRTRSDKPLRLLLNSTSRLDTQGQIVGVLVFGQDVTQMRENERRLNEAQRLEALGQLTGGIAHDFNNLLAIIQGNLSLIQHSVSPMSEDVEVSLADAQSATSDGERLIKQLLGFAKQQPLESKAISLDAAIDKALSMFVRSTPAPLQTTFQSAKSTLCVTVDPVMLESALLNLFINARDALSATGTLDINTFPRVIAEDEYSALEPGRYVDIVIADNGSGIDKNILDRVCEPFFSTKGPDKGSGLGLSMARNFVVQSKGGMEIDSVLGEGTTVTLTLPVAETSAPEETEPPQKPQKVLIVDDEERVRRMAGRLLHSFGYDFIAVGNAEDALLALSMTPDVELVFSDIMMPGSMNGKELARHIEASYPAINVLLTTGFDDANFDDGGSTFPILAKPYSAADLNEAIAALSDRNQKTQNGEGVTNRGG